MSTQKTYAVFGLGRYGIAVARELVSNGMEVIAVDIDERIVNDAADELPICKCADVTDQDVIRQLGVSNVDVVIISMATNLEASVKTVIAKAANKMHQKILNRVGADKVVFPENESGIRLAKNLLSSGFVDMVSLAKNVSIIELDLKPEWINKNLIELNLRKKYSINVIAVRKGESVSVDIDPYALLQADDKLIVIANTERLSKLNK